MQSSFQSRTVNVGDTVIEILTDADRFVGLGRIDIGATQVRSGRLPLRVNTQSFAGWELSDLRLLAVEPIGDGVCIKLEAEFAPLFVKLIRDHSFDPIHDTTDWDMPEKRSGRIDLVLEPASETFGAWTFGGFAYHYEFDSPDVPLFYLYDQASWELEGNIEGCTVFSQSACSDPVVTFAQDTAWSTEGVLFFLVEDGNANPTMTHNLPRWVDHQAWDFQFREESGATLIGVFDHVDLVRSVLMRDANKAELKHFDKHIFDETNCRSTTPKKIILNTEPKTLTDQKNLWTWMFDDLHQRARDEFGLAEQPPIPMMGHHHWVNFTIDTYYYDIVPACAAVGIRAIFAENFKRSDASEPNALIAGNMCTSHEYEISPYKGGADKFKAYIERCHEFGIKNYLWTNTYVSLNAQLNVQQRDERSWFMAMEDTRLKYGGAYTMVSSNLDLKNPSARRYWIDAHKKIVEESGLDGYFIDSHYNLFFMPVNYKSGHPQTSWRESLEVMKELQDAGVGWYIESFGPFGQPVHGHHATYSIDKAFICYYVGLGDGSATVPVPGLGDARNFKHDAANIYYQLAHKVPTFLPLFIDGKRIDQVYGEEHRRILREYHELLPQMHRRTLQEDGLAVTWHDKTSKRALLWNFADRTAPITGDIFDITAGESLPKAENYSLKALHTYRITPTSLA